MKRLRQEKGLYSPEDGIEELVFGTINRDFWSGFYGYLDSNTQQRSVRSLYYPGELNLLIVRYI
ncbi:hypothetical protein [Nostoc sp. JL34]|uniref:hypothetical protein n=1 Tax=Nostoc sp. JL34 TaxID=2815397 RepID=UPI0025D34FAD|nr:hypothetical protein [Nostoc sp. JL34]